MTFELTDIIVCSIVAALAGAAFATAWQTSRSDADDERRNYEQAIAYWRSAAEDANSRYAAAFKAHEHIVTTAARFAERNARLQREVDALRRGYMERTQQALMHNLERYVTHN